MRTVEPMAAGLVERKVDMKAVPLVSCSVVLMAKQRAARLVCSMAVMMVHTKVAVTVCSLAECSVWSLAAWTAWRMAVLMVLQTADLKGGWSVGSWGGRKAGYLVQ